MSSPQFLWSYDEMALKLAEAEAKATRLEAERDALQNDLYMARLSMDALLADNISALSRAERAEASAAKWRTMDSAPKDGTKFDVWIPDAFGGYRMTDMSFNQNGKLRHNGLLTEAELPRWPTHWMRHPPAPDATLEETPDNNERTLS
jgi:ABC-type phosphonate transport system ATPase subunit